MKRFITCEPEASPPRRRIPILAAAASAIAHLLAAAVILALPPSVSRRPSYYVLAYLVENSSVVGGPGARGVGDSAAPSKHYKGAAAARKLPHHSEAGSASHRSAGRPNPLAPFPISGKGGTVMTGSATALVPDPSSSAGEGGRREPGATDAASPFPAFGKGARGLGSGSGAAGSGEAHALYGENPAPTYPERARRDNQQGTVLLRVLVEADGSVARVEVAQSSGFDALDRAAAETVRTRWRFVPARRDGANAASWVLVPIRFALRDA